MLVVESQDDIIDFINARDNPLALYVFTQKTSNRDYIFERTRSGGVSYRWSIIAGALADPQPEQFVHNDVLVHFMIPYVIAYLERSLR